jgi:hypothetical protein
VLQELALRGDVITIDVARRRLRGVVADVGADVVALAACPDVVFVQVPRGPGGVPPIALRVVERVRAGGCRPPGRLGSFRSVCLETEARARSVVVGSLLLDDDVRGPIAVGRDHLAIRDDHETLLPLAWVGYVIAAP